MLAGLYVIVGTAWILTSSWIAQRVAPSIGALTVAEWMKGTFFMLASGVVLFLFSRRLFRDVERAAEDRAASLQSLVEAERRAVAGLLAASVAHDSRNMLTVILAGLPPPGVPLQENVAKDVRQAVTDLHQLLKHLGDLGRSEDDAPVSVELGALVSRFVEIDSAQPRLHKCSITMKTEGTVWLMAHPVRLHQIVLNLLLNAADATPSDRGHIEVRVMPREGGGGILEVHDDGSGIPEALRGQILERAVTTKPEGTGVGLLSVRDCAERHGGSVRIIPSALGGAAFRVELRDAP